MSVQRFLVLGAGPAGSATAITLASAGHAVHLVEKSRIDVPRVGELLSVEGQQWVERLLPDSFQSFYLTKLGVVGAWAERELSRYSPPSWWALDRTGLDLALAKRAQEEGARLELGAGVANLKRQGSLWHYSVGESEYQADWLVVATGRGAQGVGSHTHRLDRQVALVAFLEGEYRSTNDMLMESTELGWWYGAPIDAQRAVAVFVTDSDLDRGEPEEAWRARLSESVHAQERFSHMTLHHKPRRVAAGFSILRPAYGPGWVAVGEAAAAFCPLSSMGVGRALETGVRVGNCFVEAAGREAAPNFLALAEQNGAEFHLYSRLLADSYRQVFHFPNSVFWSRRSARSGSRRFITGMPKTPKLLFPEGQNFECSDCDKCCTSSWAPPVERELLAPLGETKPRPGYTPLRLFSDGQVVVNSDDDGNCVFLDEHRCQLHGTGLKPQACEQFPFTFTPTPEGVVVGVSFLCKSVQENTGKPLSSYRGQLTTLASKVPHTVIEKEVALSWGRTVSFIKYRAWQEQLLRARNPIVELRSLRWNLVHLLRDRPTPKTMPFKQMQRLEITMAMYLAASLQSSFSLEDMDSSAEQLLNDREVEQLMRDSRLPDTAWFRDEVFRFLRALIQRGFLLSQTPLLQRLSLLAGLPRFLEYHTLLMAAQEGAERPEKRHLFSSFDIAELELIPDAKRDLLTQAFFHWHMQLGEGEPSFYPHQKSALYGYCFETSPSKLEELREGA
ncbi:MAG: YkgJ family cysteine cluster protein [Candidatus Eremiobacteraeota bacterium]|nr:YkgJ family cysteine cluster protein [Candidatus Eremiobacteraeota bacterium]